ncbi:MAG: glycerol-3-phosphate dehydrogenase [Dictyoglomus sp. NZ13-RE01]|nr:MAG: glycerol-3-phosphate dehydrogenase [Dictyoglomus sp. NZ13-RE01]
MEKIITVLGAGSWGTALSIVLSQKGYKIRLWNKNKQLIEEIEKDRENKKYLLGIKIPHNVDLEADLEKALYKSDIVLFTVPSHAFREILKLAKPYIRKETVVVNGAKGLEVDTLYRLSEVYQEEMPANYLNYSVISGPSHAEEVSRNMPTALVVSAFNKKIQEYVQETFMLPTLRIYTNNDLVGVELGGALKNVIALATGILEGIGFGDNAKAALITRGLAEITRLGVKLGANPITFSGLTGLGDLIVTCTSWYSRNRRAGIEIGKGKKLDEVLSSIGMVVEGVKTTKAVYELSKIYNVDMPITEQTYYVLYENLSPLSAVQNLLNRDKTIEIRF